MTDKSYAKEREKKPELGFRLKSRAGVVVEAIAKNLDQRSNLMILDMGAAEGRTLLEIHAQIPQNTFIGLEQSLELIRFLPNLRGNINIVNGDVTRLPFRSGLGIFDVVSALAVLEHLESPIEAIEGAFRVLKPGGLFIATCPDPVWEYISKKSNLLSEDHHETRMSKKFIKRLIQRAGFELIEYRRFMCAMIAILPYFKIPISPSAALSIDRRLEALKMFNWLFVNQSIVCRRPEN